MNDQQKEFIEHCSMTELCTLVDALFYGSESPLPKYAKDMGITLEMLHKEMGVRIQDSEI